MNWKKMNEKEFNENFKKTDENFKWVFINCLRFLKDQNNEEDKNKIKKISNILLNGDTKKAVNELWSFINSRTIKTNNISANKHFELLDILEEFRIEKNKKKGGK